IYHLTWFKASSSRSVGSASTLYSPHQGCSSFSGLKRLILRLTFMYGPPPAARVRSQLSVVICQRTKDQGQRTSLQYLRSFGSNFVIVTGLYRSSIPRGV